MNLSALIEANLPRVQAGSLRRLANGGLSLIFLCPLLLAQPGPVSIRPDCFQFFTFTVPANSAVFDNRSAGCPYFAIAYSSNGFSVESLVVQIAPDAGGTPGAWSTYTPNSGVNPNTAITQAFSTFSGYFPWVRVQLTSVTGSGSISGIFYGWRTPAALIAGGGSSSVSITGACNSQALFNLSGSSNTQIIPLNGTTKTYICHIDLATAAAEDIKITSGTGSNCAGATADVTGLYKGISAMAQDYGPFAPLVIPSGQATCINQSVAQALGGVVIFTQAP